MGWFAVGVWIGIGVAYAIRWKPREDIWLAAAVSLTLGIIIT